jgi:flagellar basal body-associated protein FliL
VDERRYKIQDNMHTGGARKRMKWILSVIFMFILAGGASFAQMATFMTVSQIGRANNTTNDAFGNKVVSNGTNVSSYFQRKLQYYCNC